MENRGTGYNHPIQQFQNRNEYDRRQSENFNGHQTITAPALEHQYRSPQYTGRQQSAQQPQNPPRGFPIVQGGTSPIKQLNNQRYSPSRPQSFGTFLNQQPNQLQSPPPVSLSTRLPTHHQIPISGYPTAAFPPVSHAYAGHPVPTPIVRTQPIIPQVTSKQVLEYVEQKKSVVKMVSQEVEEIVPIQRTKIDYVPVQTIVEKVPVQVEVPYYVQKQVHVPVPRYIEQSAEHVVKHIIHYDGSEQQRNLYQDYIPQRPAAADQTRESITSNTTIPKIKEIYEGKVPQNNLKQTIELNPGDQGRGYSSDRSYSPYNSGRGGGYGYGDGDGGGYGYGNRGYGNRGYGNRGYGYGDRGYGDRGYGDRGYGDRGYGDRGNGDRGYGNQGYGNQGYGNQGYGNRGNNSGNQGDRGYGDRGQGDRDRGYGDGQRNGYGNNQNRGGYGAGNSDNNNYNQGGNNYNRGGGGNNQDRGNNNYGANQRTPY